MEKSPDAFRTISEVADDLDVPQHVLRFWESRFSQIRPMKRGGGRRYYRPDDVALLRGIRHLLYAQGYTIRGVQRILREQGIHFVQSAAQDGVALMEPEADEVETTPLTTENIAPDHSDIAERREPTFERPAVLGPARELTAAPQSAAVATSDTLAPGLSAAQREALRAATDELAECRRLLDAALAEEN